MTGRDADAEYQALLERVRRFVPRWVAAADRDDVAQDAVLRLIETGAHHLADDRQVRGRTRDAARAFARRFYNTERRVKVTPADDIAQVADTRLLAEDPAEAVLAGSAAAALWRAVDALPARQRTVVRLAAAGLTNREIAAHLGSTADAVRAARSRAGRALRDVVVPIVVALAVMLLAVCAARLRTPEPATPVPRIDWPFGSYGLGFVDRPLMTYCERPSSVDGAALPGVRAHTSLLQSGPHGPAVTVTLLGDRAARGGVLVGVHVPVLTRDGRNVVNMLPDAADSVVEDPRSLADAGMRFRYPVAVFPCLDRRTGQPVPLGDHYLARPLVVWRDAFGNTHEWRLPPRLIDVRPDRARRLPLLRASACVVDNGHIYAGLVSKDVSPYLNVAVVPRTVVAHRGVARLEVLVSNPYRTAVQVGHDGHRMGVGVGGRVFVLPGGVRMVLPVELRMAPCSRGRPAGSLRAGRYIVTSSSLGRTLKDTDGGVWGALVVVR